jgi:hypothetical protein
MIERADINNDGVVTEDEFELIMTRLSSKIWFIGMMYGWIGFYVW